MYKQLSGQKLRNGASLKITVLAASVQKDVLPEVRRLECGWVLQLWYQHGDIYPWQTGISEAGAPALGPERNTRNPTGEDNLFFSLWNAGTRKVIASGAAPLHAAEPMP
jgi:hypothetical protein